jgi:hypothetical protein
MLPYHSNKADGHLFDHINLFHTELLMTEEGVGEIVWIKIV